jgi:DNA modification methylase
MTAADVIAGRADCAIEHAEALDLLRALPDASVDALVTDPPYGIGFMGREWDTFEPSAVEAQTLRKARKATAVPEGHGGDIRSGGFIAYDLSLEGMRKFQLWAAEWGAEARRVLKPGGHLVAFGSPRTYHRLTCGLEDALLEVRDSLMWVHASGFPKSLNVERAVATRTCPAAGRHFARELPPPDRRRVADHVCPVTAESAPFAGTGSALKPAYEPIALCRAPIDRDGRIAGAALRHGTGFLRVDACRVASVGTHADGVNVGRWPTHLLFSHAPGCAPVGERRVPSDGHYPKARGKGGYGDTGYLGQEGLPDWRRGDEVVTAWECVPGCPVAELDAQGGNRRSGANPARRGSDKVRDVYGAFAGQADARPARGLDTGKASRFYPTFPYDLDADWPGFRYCAKATRAERDYGLDALPEALLHRVNPGGLEHDPRWAPVKRRNTHPTVKPVALMRWLVRLVCARGGVVVDPFVGSGTTAVAAAAEGVRFVGCERIQSHAELARARVAGRHGPLFAAAGVA